MRAQRTRGFTYVGVLIGVAVMGMFLAATGMLWKTQVQRDREAELLFVGMQFQRAIGSYFDRSPEAAKSYPKALDDLLEDRRSGRVERHLRRLFADPMTGSTDWALVKRSDGRIIGVHSKSEGQPLKVADFAKDLEAFADASSYREWRFVHASSASQVARAAPVAGAPASASGSPVNVEGQIGDNPIFNVPPEPRPNAKPRCEEQRIEDQRRCTAAKPEATPAELGTCMVSAAARAAACERQSSIPDLRLPK
jgi:type II secretory pathway pseudopilin PulG